jgi:NADPH:quinone reductase-like Zn-dependent oxidoreductase
MKAIIVDRYGKASGRLGQMPESELRLVDVLVEIHAAGVQLAKHLGAQTRLAQIPTT